MFKIAASLVLLAFTQVVVAQPPVLNTDPAVLSTSPGSHESGPVSFWQSPWHNGATLDGTARVTTPLGWALFAAPDAPDGPGTRSFGGVDLATGGLTHRDVQLSLPAHAGWPIGVSYSSEPLSATGAGGVLGRGWFFDTMPVLVTGTSSAGQNAPMYLVYGADAFVAYRPVNATGNTDWIGTNGAAGTLRRPGQPGGVWTLDFPDGVRAEFFDQQLSQEQNKLRRLWRYTVGVDDPETPVREDATAYVGHPTDAAVAFGQAFDANGRLTAAFDSAGRRYDFVYSAPSENLPSGRLIRVDAVLPASTVKLVARVVYRYFGDNGGPAAGTAGSTLAEIEIQTWGQGTEVMSPTQSPDSATITKRFGYADVPLAGNSNGLSQARLSRVFGYEAVRRNRIAGTSTVDLWGDGIEKVHPYASVFASWSASALDGRPVVAWTMIDGLGDVGAGANGRWNFTFDGSGVDSGSDEWIRRAVIQAPLRPVATVTTTGNSPALSDEQGRTWTIQYFGPTMQADTRVVSPVDPTSLGAGSGPGSWVNHVTRDSQGRVSRLLSPARMADFTFGAAASPRLIGAAEKTGSEGASTELQRVGGSVAAAGMVEHVVDERRSDAFGGKQITYVYSDLTIPDRTRRVWVSATKRYTDRPEHAHVPSRELVETTDVAFWPNSVVPKLIRTTPPLVSTEVLEAGSPPVARRTWTLMDRLGQRIGVFSPKKVLEEWAFDRRTGLLLRHTADANPRTGQSLDAKFAPHNGELLLELLNESGTPWSVSGEAEPYRVNTRSQYDLVGRVTFTAHPTGRISRTMRSVLPDGRLAVVDVPYLFESASSGPAGVWSLDRAEDDALDRDDESSLAAVDAMPGAVYQLAPAAVNDCLHAGTAPFVAIGHEGNVESRGTLSLGIARITTPAQLRSSADVNVVYGGVPTGGWFGTLEVGEPLLARVPIPSLLGTDVKAGELVERVLTPTGSREIERATYPLVNAQNFTAQNSSMTVSGPGNVFGGSAASHYFLTSTRYDQMGRVMAVRDQTNTIDVVRYDVIGRPVATQIGTHMPLLSSAFSIPGFSTPGTTPTGAPRLTRAMAYDQDSSGASQFGNSLPTTVTAFRSGSMADSVQRRFQYDQYEQVVASIGLSDPAPHFAASYDRNGLVLQSAVFSGPGAAALNASLKPGDASFGGTGGGNRQMLVSSEFDERFRPSATIRTPINEHTGAVAGSLSPVKETVTYGATSKPVLIVGGSGTAEKTEYNRTCSVSMKYVTSSGSAVGSNGSVNYTAATTRMADSGSPAAATFVVMSQTAYVNDPYRGQAVSVVSATALAGDGSDSGALFRTGITGANGGGTREMLDNWRGGGARLEIYKEPSRRLPELDLTTRQSKLPDIIWSNTMTTRGLVDADQNLVDAAGLGEGQQRVIAVALDGVSLPSALTRNQNGSEVPGSSQPLISTASGFSGLGMAIRSEQELSKFGMLESQWKKESQGGKDELTSMKRGMDFIPEKMFIEIDCEALCEKKRKIEEEFSFGRLKKKTIMPFAGCPGAKQESQFGYRDAPLMGGPWFPPDWNSEANAHSNREVMVERMMGYAIPEGHVIAPDGTVVPIAGPGGPPPAGSTDGRYFERDLFGNPRRIADPLFSTEPYNHIPPEQRYMLMGYKGELALQELSPAPDLRTAIPPGGTGPMHELKQFEKHWGGGLNWGSTGKTSEFGLPSDFPGMPGDFNGVLPNATRFLRDGLGGLEGITNRRNTDPSTLRGEAVYTDNDLKFTPSNPGGGLPPSRPRITEMELPGGTKINPQYGTIPGGWGNSTEQRAIQSGQPLGMMIKGFTDVNLDFLGIGGNGGAAAVRVRGLDMYDVLSPLAVPNLPTPMQPRLVPQVSPSGTNWEVGGSRVYTWSGMLDDPVVQPIIADLPPIEEYRLRTSRGLVVAAQDFMGSSRALVADGSAKWTATSSANHAADPPLEAQNHGRDIINGYFTCKDGLGGQMTGRYDDIDDALASLAGVINRSAGVGSLSDQGAAGGLTSTNQIAIAGLESLSSAETIDPPFNINCGSNGGDGFDQEEWPTNQWPDIGHPSFPPEACPPAGNQPRPTGVEEFYIRRDVPPPHSVAPPTPGVTPNPQLGVQGGGRNPGSNDIQWTAGSSLRRVPVPDGRTTPSAPAIADGGGFAAPARSDLTPAERAAFEGLDELASLDVFFSMVSGYPTASIERALNGVGPRDRVEQTMIDPRTNRRAFGVDHNGGKGNSPSGLRIPGYDLAGNLTDDGKGRKYVYDAQARLVGVYAYAISEPEGSYGPGFWDAPSLVPVAIYEYDALGRLSRATFNTNADNAVDAYDWREEYGYDHLWRLAAIWRQGPSADGNDDGRRPERYLYQQYVQVMSGFGGWGADNHRGRLDSVVCRYRDTNADGKLDEIVYYVTNWRGDVTAIWEPGVKDVTVGDEQSVTRAVIRERVRYSAWGIPTRIAPADINWDGVQDDFDITALVASLQNLSNQYIPRADLNSDGVHDGWDLDIFQQPWGYSAGEDGRGQLSGTDLSGLSYGDAVAERKNLDNRIGFGGYMWDPWLGAYHVRHRVYDPNLRRWLQVDPIGYAGGDWDLSRYCNGDPVNFVDPMGLWFEPNWGNRAWGHVTNFGAGLGDGLSLGGTSVLRNALGGGLNDTIDTRTAMYATGVGTGVTITTIASMGTATAATTGGAAAVGAISGGVGNAIVQTNQMADGHRTTFSLTEAAVNTVIGSVMGVVGQKVGNAIGNLLTRGSGGAAGAAGAGALDDVLGAGAKSCGGAGPGPLDLSKYAGPGSPQYLLKAARDQLVYIAEKLGIDKYVGITDNLTRRSIGHGARFDSYTRVGSKLTEVEARAIETYIKNTNPHFENIRRSISPDHPFYDDAMRWAEDWLSHNAPHLLP